MVIMNPNSLVGCGCNLPNRGKLWNTAWSLALKVNCVMIECQDKQPLQYERSVDVMDVFFWPQICLYKDKHENSKKNIPGLSLLHDNSLCYFRQKILTCNPGRAGIYMPMCVGLEQLAWPNVYNPSLARNLTSLCAWCLEINILCQLFSGECL